MFELMDPNTAEKYVNSLSVLEAIFVRRIVLDTMVVKDTTDYEDLLRALDRYILKHNVSSEWGLTTSQVRDFFFNLEVDDLQSMCMYLEGLKDYNNYYALLLELAKGVYAQKLDMLFDKRVESMSRREIRVYLEELLKPNSFRGCSSQIEYLVGDFAYENIFDLSNYVFEKMHDEDVNTLMKKYGVNH